MGRGPRLERKEIVSGGGVGQTWPVLFFRYGFSDFHSRITAWTTFSSPCKEGSPVTTYPGHLYLRQGPVLGVLVLPLEPLLPLLYPHLEQVPQL